MKTQLIYWPKGGSVDKVAKIIEDKLINDGVKAIAVEDIDYSQLKEADFIIIGGSTVGADNWTTSPYKDIWTTFFTKLSKLKIDLKGKKVALFGLGNQVLYPSHFVDSMKELATLASDAGAEIIGATDKIGYHFDASQALEGDKFIGLPIDDDTEPELTNQRIDAWLARING